MDILLPPWLREGFSLDPTVLEDIHRVTPRTLVMTCMSSESLRLYRFKVLLANSSESLNKLIPAVGESDAYN